ncbi:hypothetical protein EK904_005875 [Melospiza melodia maxima]|nr:hypothetical protein EK904_005875 [Melospiza melodia maxima]
MLQYGCCVRSRFVVQGDVPAMGHQAKLLAEVAPGSGSQLSAVLGSSGSVRLGKVHRVTQSAVSSVQWNCAFRLCSRLLLSLLTADGGAALMSGLWWTESVAGQKHTMSVAVGSASDGLAGQVVALFTLFFIQPHGVLERRLAFWHGRAFRLQKEDREKKFSKTACRIRRAVLETSRCY